MPLYAIFKNTDPPLNIASMAGQAAHGTNVSETSFGASGDPHSLKAVIDLQRMSRESTVGAAANINPSGTSTIHLKETKINSDI